MKGAIVGRVLGDEVDHLAGALLRREGERESSGDERDGVEVVLKHNVEKITRFAVALLLSRLSVLQRSQSGPTLLTWVRIMRETYHHPDHVVVYGGAAKIVDKKILVTPSVNKNRGFAGCKSKNGKMFYHHDNITF